MVGPCTCWNRARPMPTKEPGLHESACPVETDRRHNNAVARRLILDVQKRVTKT